MSEFLFFILGLMIGGLAMTTIMSCLQINRVNKIERKIKHEDDDSLELNK